MLKLGRYELHREIASGGMATVFLGRLTGVGGFSRAVAIKRLHAQSASDPELRAALLDEARLASRVRHPNVATILDVIDADGELCLVAEYVHGESLHALLFGSMEKGERADPRLVCAVVASTLRGLHAAHEAKNESGELLDLVHRDVTPHNVLVDVDGITRVVDFGIAKAIGRLQVTRDRSLKGTLAYMAPEQLKHRPVTRRVDIYAAALVLWEALVGARLFDGDSDGAVVAQVLRGNIPPPSTVTAGIPASLDAIVGRATARDPALRFATALEMAEAIEAAISVASPSELGAWVRRTAEETVAARSAALDELERMPASGPEPESADANERGRDAFPVATRPRTLRSRRRLAFLAAIALAGLLGPLAVVGRLRGHDSRSAQASPAPAETSSRAEPVAPAQTDPAESASSAMPEDLASQAVKTPPTRSSTTTRTRKNPRATAGSDCDPPSFLNERGQVRYKPDCLR